MPRHKAKEAPIKPKKKALRASLFTHEPLIEFEYIFTDTHDDGVQHRDKEPPMTDETTNATKPRVAKRINEAEPSSNENNNSNSSNNSDDNNNNSNSSSNNNNNKEQKGDEDHDRRRIRFADKERPASAAAGRTRPGPSVLKTPSRRRLQGNNSHLRPSSSSSKTRRRQHHQGPDGAPLELTLPAPNRQVSTAELTELIEQAEDPRLNEELTTDVVGMLSPVQRQNYYSRPAISSRMRMSEYQKHRLNWAHPLRLSDAHGMPVNRWDTTTKPLGAADFHADRTKALGAHRPRARSSALRRYHTGKAIVNYSSVVGKSTLPMSEMKKAWNRVTKPTTFCAATSAVKGERQKYGYGATVAPPGGYDLGRELSSSDEQSLNMAAKTDTGANNRRKERRAERTERTEQRRQETQRRQRRQRPRTKKTSTRRPRTSGSVISRRIAHHPRALLGHVASGFRMQHDQFDNVEYSEQYKAKMKQRSRNRNEKRRSGR